ncbi:hypothetical protein ABW21_db0200357 [Orbilia brochopaga]|nr:hypothetical protein ABW21_db0200357 [Drechslerella brochopaga]
MPSDAQTSTEEPPSCRYTSPPPGPSCKPILSPSLKHDHKTTPPHLHIATTTSRDTAIYIPRARRLLLHLVFGFLLLNTALFALAVHNVEQTAIIALNSDEAICPCPSANTAACSMTFNINTGMTAQSLSRLVYLHANRIPGRGYSVHTHPTSTSITGITGDGDMMYAGDMVNAEGVSGQDKMQMWRMCVWQVRAVRAWRWWMQWMVLPGQCLLEIAVAWVWWRCLVDDEREEEKRSGKV